MNVYLKWQTMMGKAWESEMERPGLKIFVSYYMCYFQLLKFPDPKFTHKNGHNNHVSSDSQYFNEHEIMSMKKLYKK